MIKSTAATNTLSLHCSAIIPEPKTPPEVPSKVLLDNCRLRLS